MDEKWGCIKHIGMSYDMYMRMPIDERREFIHRHNMEQMEISNNSKPNGNERTYEGEAINKFAQMSQSDKKRGL
jgi:hypothetical protein